MKKPVFGARRRTRLKRKNESWNLLPIRARAILGTRDVSLYETITKLPTLQQLRHFGSGFVSPPRRILAIYGFVVLPRHSTKWRNFATKKSFVMISMPIRTILFGSLALFGVSLGALFAYFRAEPGGFAAVEINGASLVAEVAADRQAWARGLSGRDALGENHAMLFVFDQPDRYVIWMKEMRFPIDIFWIRNGLIVDMEEEAPPPAPGTGEESIPTYGPEADAEMVLETRAGFARRYGIRIGDRARISRGTSAQMDARAEGASSVAPGEEFTIDAMRASPARGRELRIGEVISSAADYQKFSITYASGVLMLTGAMNVPYGTVPEAGFPVIILNHGLIDPAIYVSGRGSRREQDFFARNGYITIHPDYRGHASSSPNPSAHHDFYTGYTQDVMALIAAITASGNPLFDIERIGMWGHSMGGGIAARAMVLSPDVRAYVLFAPISADAEENFYELPADEVQWLRATYGGDGAELYRRISPIEYFADVRAPVQLHHGIADRDVSAAFSEKMFETLTRFNKKAEFFIYPGEPHEFADAWPLAASRALQFFDTYVKNAR